MTATDTATVDTDWWYVRAYPGRPDLMDDATGVLVPWLRRQAEREGSDRWFFMRYLDMTGNHLRLRLRCTPDSADRLHGRIAEVADLLHTVRGSGSGARLIPGSGSHDRGGPQKVRAGLYAPELGKYGGEHGVSLAEELFTRSSIWYVENDVAGLDPVSGRAALAVTYMDRVVHAALPGHEDEFWARHRRQWGWQLRAAVPRQDDLRPVLAQVSSAVTSSNDTGSPRLDNLDEHVAYVVQSLAGAARGSNRIPQDLLLLHYLHMDINRWGFLPAEECALGIIASMRSRNSRRTA